MESDLCPSCQCSYSQDSKSLSLSECNHQICEKCARSKFEEDGQIECYCKKTTLVNKLEDLTVNEAFTVNEDLERQLLIHREEIRDLLYSWSGPNEKLSNEAFTEFLQEILRLRSSHKADIIKHQITSYCSEQPLCSKHPTEAARYIEIATKIFLCESCEGSEKLTFEDIKQEVQEWRTKSTGSLRSGLLKYIKSPSDFDFGALAYECIKQRERPPNDPVTFGSVCPGCLDLFSVLEKTPVELPCGRGHFVCYECYTKTRESNKGFCAQDGEQINGKGDIKELQELCQYLVCSNCKENRNDEKNYQLPCNKHYICSACLESRKKFNSIVCGCYEGIQYPAIEYPKCEFLEQLRRLYSPECHSHNQPADRISVSSNKIYCPSCDVIPGANKIDNPKIDMVRNRLLKRLGSSCEFKETYTLPKLIKKNANKSSEPLYKIERFSLIYPIEGRLPKVWRVFPDQVEAIEISPSLSIYLRSIILAGFTKTPNNNPEEISVQFSIQFSIQNTSHRMRQERYFLSKKQNKCKFEPLLIEGGSSVQVVVQYPAQSRLYCGAPDSQRILLENDSVQFSIQKVDGSGNNHVGGPILGWTFSRNKA